MSHYFLHSMLGHKTICSPSTGYITLGLRPRAILPASGEQIVMSPSLKGNNCIISNYLGLSHPVTHNIGRTGCFKIQIVPIYRQLCTCIYIYLYIYQCS